MTDTLPMKRIKFKPNSTDVHFVLLRQKEVGIEVREERGAVLLVDAADCEEVFLLASLFRHVMRSQDIVYLERGDDRHADLFIFNGAVTPLTHKDLGKIKSSISYTKAIPFELPLIHSHDEEVWKTWQHWKYDGQLRVQAGQDRAILNASRLGLELLTEVCGYLASSYIGHSHLDWASTKSSLELIIRNTARNY
ncbi:hypothetical protein DCC85_05325 [Paenibacillus sp. CAA11]|uniref:hypothetical protein n=1 Tax=Paenibacillus sp. CAA11 TaxID=1532905 RepID=UPI000D3C5DFA|nr:hypothetical protein [Paenibacillus sp. CAA11]AWB43695.1 hypothetical protein DCC85_05325 [Paenibacillus sp. CAA11]